MDNLESYTSEESIEFEVPETVLNEGPTILVGLGLQLTADNERLTARTWNIPDILWMKAANGTLENTVVILSGGHTGREGDERSEAEVMFERLQERSRYLKNTHLSALKERIHLIPARLDFLTQNKSKSVEFEENHWGVPVFIDDNASSLLENFQYIPSNKYNSEKAMISLFAGPARPSAHRAAYVASTLFPNARIETFQNDEGSEIERIKNALTKEGIAAALQETAFAEKSIQIATEYGFGEILNKLTKMRIKR